MSLNTEADLGARRLRLMVGYCGYLYGVMPTSEISVIETYQTRLQVGSVEVSKIVAALELDTVDDCIELPSIPSAAARKITAGLSRLNQIEGVDSYKTLYDLLGTSPTDTARTHDRARSAAVTANSRRRFNDPRKSIIGELLSYCRMYLSTNNNPEYICFTAKNALEPLCTALVASGIHGRPLWEELVATARRHGLRPALGTVLASHLIKAETGGLTTAIQMGFTVCARCGTEKLSVMTCECPNQNPGPEAPANNTAPVDWNSLMESGASALRQLTLQMTTPLGLPDFKYSRLREAPTGVVQMLLDAQNPNRVFELRPGDLHEHPAPQWQIAIQLEPDSKAMKITGNLSTFTFSLSDATQNKWMEIEGSDGKILPIRLIISRTRRTFRTSADDVTETNSLLQRFMETLGGATFMYGRWLQ